MKLSGGSGVIVGLVVLASLVGASTTAFAQSGPPEDTKTRADRLFREAEQLFQDGEIAAACARYSESQHLDPALGTLINLALCHERQGRTATAIREFRAALALATEKNELDRAQLLNDEIAKLAVRLTRIIFVKDGFEYPVELRLDTVIYGNEAFVTPLTVDPGLHTLVVSAPGMRQLAVSINVQEQPGATQSIHVAPLVPTVGAATGAPAPPPPTADGATTRKILGWSLLGVGAGGVATGMVLALSALGDKARFDERCAVSKDECVAPSTIAANDSAHDKERGALIAIAAGAAVGVFGGWLLLSGGRAPTSTPNVTLAPRAASRTGLVSIEGVW